MATVDGDRGRPAPAGAAEAPRVALAPIRAPDRLGIVAALPFVWMILASFKTGGGDPADPADVPARRIRRSTTTATILNDPELPLGLFYRNSAFIAIANVIATLFTGSLLGYILAKFRFPGRRRCSGSSSRR